MEPAAGFQVVDPWDDNAPVAPAHQTIDATTEFYILPGVFKTEVCVGFDSQAVARVLLDVGALKPSTDDSFTRRERLPEIGLTRVYRITSAIWEAEA
jgi:uncharacterized protein (DUF927 family)